MVWGEDLSLPAVGNTGSPLTRTGTAERREGGLQRREEKEGKTISGIDRDTELLCTIRSIYQVLMSQSRIREPSQHHRHHPTRSFSSGAVVCTDSLLMTLALVYVSGCCLQKERAGEPERSRTSEASILTPGQPDRRQ